MATRNPDSAGDLVHNLERILMAIDDLGGRERLT
jgi:hypothetical protein